MSVLSPKPRSSAFPSPKALLRAALPALLLAALWFSLPAATTFAQGPAPSAGSGESSTPEAQSPEKNRQEADETDAYKHSAVVKLLGSKLGMNPDQAATVFEVTNFAVLAILVGIFLTKTLPKTFRNRTGSIQKHLVEARMATEEATARINSVEARLGKLDAQIAAMREQAEKDWNAEEQRVRAAVDEEKGKIVAATEQEIASATAQARRQIQIFAADLAIDQAAKRLVVSAETDRLLVQSFARRLSGNDDREGQN